LQQQNHIQDGPQDSAEPPHGKQTDEPGEEANTERQANAEEQGASSDAGVQLDTEQIEEPLGQIQALVEQISIMNPEW